MTGTPEFDEVEPLYEVPVGLGFGGRRELFELPAPDDTESVMPALPAVLLPLSGVPLDIPISRPAGIAFMPLVPMP